jgi:hypothetical protein
VKSGVTVTPRQARKIAQSAEQCDSLRQDFFSPEQLPEFATVLPRKTWTERQREFGGVWLGNKFFDKLEIDRYFAAGLKAE